MTGTTDERSTGGPGDATPTPPDELSFDDALAELQRTITELETGNLPLERTLALHERGAALLERCETLLRSAELRMRQLVAKGSTLETVEVTEDRTIDEV
ncbi:MAG TPA: exodeoxyribonuclease VII small subunit [Candidatus Limnocylindrales bacterium]|nr:exodeoxyribonuclease VII small subunit [Candidatus Limnocylindrales bacterium]